MSKTLTFVRWHCKYAVYLGDNLTFYGEHVRDSWALLESLGYECKTGGEVPRLSDTEEFDKDHLGYWKPSQSLAVLKDQFRMYEERQKREEIIRLRRRLAELEGDKP